MVLSKRVTSALALFVCFMVMPEKAEARQPSLRDVLHKRLSVSTEALSVQDDRYRYALDATEVCLQETEQRGNNWLNNCDNGEPHLTCLTGQVLR